MPMQRLPVQRGQSPVRSVNPHGDLIQMVDRRIERKAAYAQEPHAVMVVVDVGVGAANTVRLKRPTDANHNGFNFPWIVNGTTYAPGDVVLVSMDRSFPHVVGKLSG
jgi:hypothetical protein